MAAPGRGREAKSLACPGNLAASPAAGLAYRSMNARSVWGSSWPKTCAANFIGKAIVVHVLPSIWQGRRQAVFRKHDWAFCNHCAKLVLRAHEHAWEVVRHELNDLVLAQGVRSNRRPGVFRVSKSECDLRCVAWWCNPGDVLMQQIGYSLRVPRAVGGIESNDGLFWTHDASSVG